MAFFKLRISPFARSLVTILFLIFISFNAAEAGKPAGKGKGGGGSGGGSSYVAMALDTEDYDFRNLSGDNSCLGEDDHLTWRAVGSLNPGESFSFTPQYPACNGHPAAISVVANWVGGPLDLTSNVPDNDFASSDPGQKGQPVLAPVVGQGAQLCMFPAYASDGLNFTVTLTNNGPEPVHDIVLEGRGENDWPIYYYERCINADADGDGWNDSLEHTMANLVYPNGYLDGQFQQDLLWGSNYLKGRAGSSGSDDEVDTYPPDFDDDGLVDQRDVDALTLHLGEGNGIPLEGISPNPSDAEWYNYNTLPWRRYDLDGDGFVGEEDLAIVETLAGMSIPMSGDPVAPTARVVDPEDGMVIPRGQYFLIRGHAWDNLGLTRVDYKVDGKTICSVTDPMPSFGFDSPFYSCWWEVPKRRGSYSLTVEAHDAAGHVTASPGLQVSAQ